MTYTTRKGARQEAERVNQVPPDQCPDVESHDDDGAGGLWCRSGECRLSHFTTCVWCGQQSIFVVGDSAPTHHDDCLDPHDEPDPSHVVEWAQEYVAELFDVTPSELERRLLMCPDCLQMDGCCECDRSQPQVLGPLPEEVAPCPAPSPA